MEVCYGVIRQRVLGVQDRAKVQRCKGRAERNDETKSEFWGKNFLVFQSRYKSLKYK